jgi:hypothetical protein
MGIRRGVELLYDREHLARSFVKALDKARAYSVSATKHPHSAELPVVCTRDLFR